MMTYLTVARIEAQLLQSSDDLLLGVVGVSVSDQDDGLRW